jgi:MFS family permease
MGFLLGALILGTAFPHLLKNRGFELPWKSVLYYTSTFTAIGGLLMLIFVGDGPYRKKSGGFQWNAFGKIFNSKKWRQAAIGYFGHMWELYTFWGFLPVILALYANLKGIKLNIPLLSFLIIATGSIGAIAGGYLSRSWGSAKVASTALFISGLCCFLSPLAYSLPLFLFLIFLFIWGLTVSPDSPQFSTLVAQYAPEELRGTALTIYNSIGFSISTVSLIVIDRIFYSAGFFAKENTMLLLGIAINDQVNKK